MLLRILVASFLFLAIPLTIQPITAQSPTLKVQWTKISQDIATGASISPNGKLIIFGNWKTNQLTLMDWQTKQVVWQLSQRFNMDGRLYWSPDGKLIASVAGGSVYLYEAANGHHVSQIETSLDAYKDLLGVLSGSGDMGFGYTDLKWSLDSRQLAVMVYGYVLVYDLELHKTITVVDLTAVPPPNDVHTYLYWFDWSPDGSKFAAFHFMLDDKGVPLLPVTINIGFWDKYGYWLPQYEQTTASVEACVPDGEHLFAGLAYPPGVDIAWSTDNKTVAVSAADFTVCRLGEDGTLRVRKISDLPALSIHWTADKKWLIGFVDGGCSILISDLINDYSTNTQTKASGEPCGLPSWSQDDRFIAVGGDDGLWVGRVEFK